MKHLLIREAAIRRFADLKFLARSLFNPIANAGQPTPVAYIHIGTVKTGTTYLQKTFWQNAGIFGQLGIDYPFVFPAQTHLPRYANAEFMVDRSRDREAAERFVSSEAQKLVVSEEGTFFFMPRLNHPALKRLKRKVILYVRRPSEVILSWAAESSQPYNAFLAVSTTKNVGPMSIGRAIRVHSRGYEAGIHRFMRFVERNPHIEVIVRPYERESWVGGDLLTDFLHCLQVDARQVYDHPDFRNPGITNEGHCRKFCDISHAVWKLLGKPTIPIPYEFALVREICDEARIGDNRPAIETVSDKVIDQLSDRFAFFERFLSKRYFDGAPVFKNRFPKIYGTARPPHIRLDMREIEALTRMLVARRELSALRGGGWNADAA